MYSILSVNLLNKGAISRIYAFILNSYSYAWGKAKAEWEGEVGLYQKTPGKILYSVYTRLPSVSGPATRHSPTLPLQAWLQGRAPVTLSLAG